MSVPQPRDAREVIAEALADRPLVERNPEKWTYVYLTHADTVLAALEAAGFSLIRTGLSTDAVDAALKFAHREARIRRGWDAHDAARSIGVSLDVLDELARWKPT